MSRSWRIGLTGYTVYRRRAHLVVWDGHMRLTVDPWPLYWSSHDLCTYACISRVGMEGLWLPVRSLVGHWNWFTGDIAGVRILDGWGPSGMPYPKYEQIWPSNSVDPDTGVTYWRSDRGRLCYWRKDPMAHT